MWIRTCASEVHLYGLSPVWIRTCVFKNFVKILHHRFHRVSPLCGYGHVSSNYPFVKIVQNRFHICRVSPLCAHGHVSSNYHLMRIVHHRYHTCRVSPLCGYGHGSSNYNLLRITGITLVAFIPCVDTDMCLQMTTL